MNKIFQKITAEKESWAIVPITNEKEPFFLFLSTPILEEQIDLNKISKEDVLIYLESEFKNSVSSDVAHFQITHLPYDLTYKLQSIDTKLKARDDFSEKIINIKFKNLEKIKFTDWQKWRTREINLTLDNNLKYSDYLNKFKKSRKNLLLGNCYQMNLTEQFNYHFDQGLSAIDFAVKLWSEKKNIASFAHATWLSSSNQLLLSNSPECLFQIKSKYDSYKVITMPIKGTQKIDKSIKESIYKLSQSKKDMAELNMISDLLRNDLSRISKPNAKIVKSRMPLIVPGLIHQFSIVESKISPETPLSKVILNLFPGGSITGAPKKSVIQRLLQIEKRKRGHYCGSTIIQYKKLKCCNINIRTAEVDLPSLVLRYSSGGGITLLSKAKDEYLEMMAKRDSFINIFLKSSRRQKYFPLI